MREPKKLKSSPTGGGGGGTANTSDNGLPVASPLSRQPKTPKQLDGIPAPDTPGSRTEVQWPPAQSQTPTSQARALKAEQQSSSLSSAAEMPPPTPEAGTPLSMRSPGMMTIPSSPLDQFKKEDPILSLAHMTTSIGSNPTGSSLLSMRSPSSASVSAAPSTPTSYIPLSPAANTMSRAAAGHQLTHGAMSPHLSAGMMMPQQPQQQVPPPNHGMPPGDQPYLPNQNCIYVFDTNLANQAAAAVSEQIVQNIIDFHQRQEETQRFLSRCQMEGRAWNLPPPQQQLQQQRSHNMMPAGFMQQQQPGRPQLRPDFSSSGVTIQAQQLQTKQMKMEKLKQYKNILLPEEIRQVAPPPPYGPPPIANMGGVGMMPSRPLRPSGPTSRSKRSLQMETSTTISLEEVNFQAQQQQQQSMEMMIKTESNMSSSSCLSPGFSDSSGGPYLAKDGTTSSVMPVPSPQPIQYLSSQLDQEVVIQKQPNRNFMRGPANGPPGGGPRGMSGPRMRAGMMPMGAEHINPQFAQHMAGPRMNGGVMMSGAGGPGQNMPSSISAHMHQQSQFQSQHFSPQSAGYLGPNGHPLPQCMSEMSAGMRHPGAGGSNGPCSPNQQMLQAQEFEASMRAQFHGGGSTGAGAASHHQMNMNQKPQTVNNTYVNANIAIEHVNIQNLPAYAGDGGAGGPHFQTHGGQGSVNFSSDMHLPPSGQQQMNNGLTPSAMAYHQQHQQQQQSSFDASAPQIHIRPNQPNTIQYYPNRPPPPKQARPPLNLDFLQPWTNSGGPPRGAGPPLPMGQGPGHHHAMSSGGFMQQQGGQMMYGGGGGPPSSLGAGGGGGGMPNGGLPPQMQENNGYPSPNHQQMMGGPGSNGDGQFAAGYQQFQQQLYASNVASSRQQQAGSSQPAAVASATAPPPQ